MTRSSLRVSISLLASVFCGSGFAAEAPAKKHVANLAQIDDAIRRGVDFLIADQNSNGSWGGPTRT